MYELNSEKVSSVAGGNNEILGGVILFGGILTLAALAGIGSRPRCTIVEKEYTEHVPVYDPMTGVFLGTQHNTYLVPEEVCYY